MTRKLKTIIEEIPDILKLAGPVALSQLGQMLMGTVDTLFMGQLGPEYIGGVALGGSIFFAASVFGIGLLFGLDPLVSKAFGEKNLEECHHWLLQGLYLATIASIPLTVLPIALNHVVPYLGYEAELARQSQAYLFVISFTAWPLLLFLACRQYLQAMNRVLFVTLVMLLANILNAFLNWVFVFGNLGVPRLESQGAAIATLITRWVILAALVGYIFWRDRKMSLGLGKISWQPQLARLKTLCVIGIPSGLQVVFEVAVFGLCTVLAGRLGAEALAAHSIVLNMASLTFMVPLGISAAAAVRVGQRFGERDYARSRLAGWTSLFLGTCFMVVSGLVMMVFNTSLVSLYNDNSQVLYLGGLIIFFAAAFQVADGLQTVGTGALRGLAETRFPMYANLIGHWLIGLPAGILLCFMFPIFGKGHEVLGLWAGLTIGLLVVAASIVWKWHRISKAMVTKRLNPDGAKDSSASVRPITI